MPTSHAANGTNFAANGDSRDPPRRLCFGFQIELKDIQGETLAASLGFDSIVYDQFYEAWDAAEFTRRALNKMQKAARAMALRYPATNYATIRIAQSDAINSVFKTVHIALRK